MPLSHIRGLVFRILPVTRSRIVPKGQIQPQKNRPEDYREDKREDARQQNPCEGVCGQKEAHENEGIGPKKTVDGYGDFILASIIGDDEEDEKDDEKDKLGYTGRGKFHGHSNSLG